MNEIRCPKCGEPFQVDEVGYAAIVKQVRDKEFNAELKQREDSFKTEKDNAVAIAKAQQEKEFSNTISQLKNEITDLQGQVNNSKTEKDLAVRNAQMVKEQEASESIDKLKKQISELESRLGISEKEKEFAVAKAVSEMNERLAEKDNAVAIARAQQEKEFSNTISQLKNEITDLQGQVNNSKTEKDLAVRNAQMVKEQEASESIDKLKKQISELESRLGISEKEKEFAVAKAVSEMNERLAEKDTEIIKLNGKVESTQKDIELKQTELKAKYEAQLSAKQEEIDFYKDFKARQSTKMIGESLEQHCEIEFNKLRATAFKNAYFEKDNDARSGSKGDYIYRETDENGVEIISIMFEMKNEMDTTATKHKNEDFFKELDKDRNEKCCEYAVLVTLLEADSELYNSGIVDVSHKYNKMYVIRPQFFIPMITLLRNAALNSLEYKQELFSVRNQNIDITHFEENLLDFKDKFSYNYNQAHKRFNEAIEEIDKSISHLQKIKDALTKSDNQLRLANAKVEDVSIKKLTKGNPTMQEKFAQAGYQE